MAEKRTITLNEGLAWMKVLRQRHAELVTLRNWNSESERRFFGSDAAKEVLKAPTYDVKALDKLISGVAKEIRILDAAIKRTNAVTEILGYTQDEAALGELS